MNNNWTSKPTKIKNWERAIDYVMFVDENGNSDVKDILKCLSKNEQIDINNNFFTVTGVIFTRAQYIVAKNKLNEIKLKYWKNGTYLYKENDLLKHYQFNVYNTAMCFLLQRYIYVMPSNCTGLVMLEARGKDEDYLLLNEMKHIIFETGIKNISSDELQQKIAGIYFNPKWSKCYDDTFAGLEIADLTSYPIHKYVRNKVKDRAFTILEKKIDKYPNYENKGIKIFP